MPLQNRVDPFGAIVATSERGTILGNRGLLHDKHQRIVRPWRLKRWIACLLAFRGRQRTVMSPGLYTELFFLDEATALAAGHRPCAECRRADLLRFKAAWLRGNAAGPFTADSLLPLMDDILHAERLDATGGKRTYRAPLRRLPSGVIVAVGGKPFLWHDGRLRRWSFAGYSRGKAGSGLVTVLTPPSVVAAIEAGYAPILHPSATA
ncbi:MAG: hypothetical protein U0746_11480 [Gemmataceae bacterium]